VGLAQSNARVSTLMRSIEDSPWLGKPTLVEIHATGSGSTRLSEFSLNFELRQAVPIPAPNKPAPVKGSPAATLDPKYNVRFPVNPESDVKS